MSECNHDCEHCEQNCSSNPQIEKLTLNEKSSIKKIIGVLSGKGGVGKSLVSSLLACELAKKGYSVGILDADILGPSIPKAFNITQKAYSQDNLIIPAKSKNLGIDIISSKMLLENDDDPILWRGSLVSNLVNQFYKDVDWGKKDYLIIDLPPGTGDVALTILQMIPVDGLVFVSTPQKLVTEVFFKAIKMAELMNIKMYGVVENMSYLKCPDCGKKIALFGESTTEEKIKEFNIKVIDRLPLDPELSNKVDLGEIETLNEEYLPGLVNLVKED